MSTIFRTAAIVLVFIPLASGCSSMPRWDWWRSAQTGPPPGAMMAKNEAPKSTYPKLPSTNATPANLTASTAPTNGTPPGTSAPDTGAPATGYPTTNTAAAGATLPASYPSTPATGGYPATGGNYSAQTGSYDPNAYNPYGGATQAPVQVASNPNAYTPPTGGYTNPGTYPATNPEGGYPSTNTAYSNTPASYGAPAAGAGGATDPSGYGTGSRYDAPAGDRYGTPAPAGTNYGAPDNNYGAPGGTGYPAPTNNYGAPANNYPTAPAYGGYQGSDATPPSSTTNYAAAPTSTSDRYSNVSQDGTSTAPTGTTRYDSAVTPTSGGAYLPAGTKLLEGEAPTAPVSTPSGGSTTSPYGGYQNPGGMG